MKEFRHVELRLVKRGVFRNRTPVSTLLFTRVKPYFPLPHGVPIVDDKRIVRGPPTSSSMACNGKMVLASMGHTSHSLQSLCPLEPLGNF